MFTKILVAEDHENASLGLQKTIEYLGVSETIYVSYCDDALQEIKNAINHKNPFQLLITDLSFEDDFIPQKLTSGKELILAARLVQPDLKVLVFSIENKIKAIENLFKEYHINGFVSKSRNDSVDLKKAIVSIYNKEEYLSTEFKKKLKQNNSINLSHVEIMILSLLSKGILQKNIPIYLQEKNIKPGSLSSVEKIINNLRETFDANNNEQLIAICKDLGIL